MYKEIPIKDIVIPDRRRPLRGVEQIAESIVENGLIHPITVTEDYHLVAGYHRLKACELLQWKDVPANVLSLDELDAHLIEIDENLVRHELDALERATLLDQRKRIYEAKYPMTKKGGDFSSPDAREKKAESVSLPSFTSRTANQTDMSFRTIQEDISIARKLCPEVIDSIRNTPLANQKKDLLRLSKLPPDTQMRVADKALAEPAKRMSEVIHEDAVSVTLSQPCNHERPTISKVDVTEFLSSLSSRSVDLLLTNPPHQADDLNSFVRSWIPLALSRVKESGQAFIVASADPEELYAYLSILRESPSLRLKNILIRNFAHTSSTSISRTSYRVNWQPVFYLRGKSANAIDCPIADEQLASQNSEGLNELAERLIRHGSKVGETVLDPFAGSGVVVLAAARLGRKTLGCESGIEALEAAERAGCLIDSQT